MAPLAKPCASPVFTVAADMARFLNRLRDLVLHETAAQRQKIHDQWQKSILFLMGAHSLYEREQSVRLSDEGRLIKAS
jgi:hypothetical protein